ncbi:MAG: hypothetical protein AAF499_19045, partial [Pseudomonadota bacterium]
RVVVGAYSHSNVIEVLVSTGVIGFLLYYSIYLAFVVRCFSMLRIDSSHTTARMALVALATLALMDIQHVSFDTKQGWLFLAVLIGTVEVSRRQLFARRARARTAASAPPSSSADQPPTAPEVTGLRKNVLTKTAAIAPAPALTLDTSRRVILPSAQKLED